jgi:eukaryotic-like serine/threonine-protein kinase
MKTTGRFEIREVLGEGGMGVVYRAFDPVMNREVTLKTIRNPQDRTALDLFKREISVLASLAHPNIVEIHDVGEIEESGTRCPYFVMPLLRGATLEELIKSASARLTVDRSIQIAGQTCRGLQAAHDHGLVHRDLKPSNVFVLEDDSVKIIDFGVAHLIDQRTTTGLKGTLLYMAPEQLLLKPPTPLSDQFSLGVVCFEMLAHRHPFAVPGFKDTAQTILNHIPPPVSKLNHAVNQAVSQVIHKAMAKDPFHRFASVREFGDCLQKASRNEPIEIFDPSKLEPRLERARKALTAGDLEFAGEILRELEAEFTNPEIAQVREALTSTRRRTTIQALLETARRRFEEEEYLLALQKVQEILDIEPANTDARTLQGQIEEKRSSAQIEGSLRLAQQHLENHAYVLARQAIQKVLQLRPKDARAQALLAETDRREQETLRIRQEKEKAYQAAVESYQEGEITAALSKLERVLELDRRTTDATTPGQSAGYQKLYDEVRSKRDKLEDLFGQVKKSFGDGNLDAALALCDEVLLEFPNNVVFGNLKFDIEDAKRQEVSAYIARIEREVASEPDLNRKVAILQEAKQKHPQEDRFSNSLERVKLRRDQVEGIAARARALEDGGQFSEALSKWEDLRKTYAQYPGLDVEIERVRHRREQQSRSEAKAQWVTEIDQALGVLDFANASSLADQALAEFQQDPELLALQKAAQSGLKRFEKASHRLAEGQELLEQGQWEDGLNALREAVKLDPQSQGARKVLVEMLLRKAQALFDSDWRAAEKFVDEAQESDPGNPLARSLRTLIRDRQEEEEITLALSKARELQSQDDLRGAIAELDNALVSYPGRERLEQRRNVLLDTLPPEQREAERVRDLAEARRLEEQARQSEDPRELESIFAQTRVYGSKYSGDSDFQETVTSIESRVQSRTTAAPPPPPVPAGAASRGAARPRLALPRIPPTAAIAGVAALLAILAAAGAWRTWKPKARPAEAPVLARVVLQGQTQGATLLDANGKNVIGQAASGLPAGAYTLVDSRPGFAAVRQAVTIATGERERPVSVVWKALPVFLALQGVAHGGWKLDGQPAAGPRLELTDGPHELVWSDGRVEIRLPIRVEAGKAELDPWKASAPVNGFGLGVAVGREAVTWRRLNVAKLRYRVGAADPQVTDADGQVGPPDQPVAFEAAAYNYPLVKVEPLDLRAQSGQVYAFLYVARPGTGAAKPKPAESEPEPVGRPVEPSAAPAPAPAPVREETPEERVRRKLREGGYDDRVLKKQGKQP